MKFNFLDRVSKQAQMSNFIKSPPGGPSPGGRTDTTRLIVAFRYSAKVPKKMDLCPVTKKCRNSIQKTRQQY